MELADATLGAMAVVAILLLFTGVVLFTEEE
jgi:hypothetical protein